MPILALSYSLEVTSVPHTIPVEPAGARPRSARCGRRDQRSTRGWRALLTCVRRRIAPRNVGQNGPTGTTEDCMCAVLEPGRYDTDKSRLYLRNYERFFAPLAAREI